MTKGQQLRHHIARLSLVRSLPRHKSNTPDGGNLPFVKFYEQDIAMLGDILGALARLLDDEGVPAQSWTSEVTSTRRVANG